MVSFRICHKVDAYLLCLAQSRCCGRTSPLLCSPSYLSHPPAMSNPAAVDQVQPPLSVNPAPYEAPLRKTLQSTTSQFDQYDIRSSSETKIFSLSQISDIQLRDAGDESFTQIEPFIASFADVDDARTTDDNLGIGVYSQQVAYLQPNKLHLLHIDK